MKKIFKENGMIFIAATVIMMLLLSLGAGYMAMTRVEMQSSRNEIEALRAFYYAESGMEHLIAKLRNSEINWDDPTAEAWEDIDGDAQTDYWTSINWTDNTMTCAYMPPPTVSANRTLAVQIFPGDIIQAEGNINPVINVTGQVNGDVDATGPIATNLGNVIDETVYQINNNNNNLSVPKPIFSAYANPANFTNHYTHSDCASLTFTPPDGVHYVTGDCSISGGGPFVLNGTLVVTGNLAITAISNSFTITPTGNNPAIVVGGTFNATSLNSTTIGDPVLHNGLIYAGGGINFATFAFNTNINGPIISGGGISLQTIRMFVNFDPAVKFPYFSGGAGGAVDVYTWRESPT